MPWECHSCTFVNSKGTKCDVCRALKKSECKFKKQANSNVPGEPVHTTDPPHLSFSSTIPTDPRYIPAAPSQLEGSTKKPKRGQAQPILSIDGRRQRDDKREYRAKYAGTGCFYQICYGHMPNQVLKRGALSRKW